MATNDPFLATLDLLRRLRRPHTVRCLARQWRCSRKTIYREIDRLRILGFDVREKIADEFGSKSYWVVGAKRTIEKLLSGE